MTKQQFLRRIHGLRKPVSIYLSFGAKEVLSGDGYHPDLLSRVRLVSRHRTGSEATTTMRKYRKWLEKTNG